MIILKKNPPKLEIPELDTNYERPLFVLPTSHSKNLTKKEKYKSKKQPKKNNQINMSKEDEIKLNDSFKKISKTGNYFFKNNKDNVEFLKKISTRPKKILKKNIALPQIEWIDGKKKENKNENRIALPQIEWIDSKKKENKNENRLVLPTSHSLNLIKKKKQATKKKKTTNATKKNKRKWIDKYFDDKEKENKNENRLVLPTSHSLDLIKKKKLGTKKKKATNITKKIKK